jgi:hypothetical protein
MCLRGARRRNYAPEADVRSGIAHVEREINRLRRSDSNWGFACVAFHHPKLVAFFGFRKRFRGSGAIGYAREETPMRFASRRYSGVLH